MSTSQASLVQHIPYRYLLQEAGLFFLFTGVLLFAGTWRAYADFGLIRIGVAALSAAAGLWLVLRLAHRWDAPSPLGLPLIIFLIAYVTAALTSIQARRSLDEVWVAAMYVFCFCLAAQLVSNGWPRELFVKTFLVAGLLLMGISGYLAFNWYRG